ncbi:NEDD8 ultimate buster 1-like [Liolophura sinensis]|uniref:NEDD8 ultimate buster 1-like n=1 Tax=Liolophura sinensis TaxID=3198878 RepID=UPI0031594DEE
MVIKHQSKNGKVRKCKGINTGYIVMVENVIFCFRCIGQDISDLQTLETKGIMSSIKDDVFQKAVRDKLNSEKIKLWEPPYTTENKEKGEVPKDLANRYSSDLNIPFDDVLTILETLRVNALQKLADREKFQKSGLATLKVRLAGQCPNPVKGKSGKAMLSLEVKLNSTGEELKKMISSQVTISAQMLKLICGGRVIEDRQTLEEQRVKNGSQMMAVCLTETEAEARLGQERVRKVAKTREAAELLSDKVRDDEDPNSGYYLQVADQTGKPLDLPKEERKALALAMTLHEKGRAALKRRDYGEALLVLLEADKEFSKCRADILSAVDNYAVLCLDIVWCYLCLENVDQLPDADRRLKACEECFERSYGKNLERLAAVKGGTGNELVLFMKLHLLQGVLAFHQHRKQEASRLLQVADSELRRLRVDDDKLSQVLSMGFGEQEARLALRATNGQVDTAITHIMKRREEKEARKRKEKEEREKLSAGRKLGKTADGQWVNVDTFNMLLSMGFKKGASREALRQANNNLSSALEVLQNHPELLSLPDPDLDLSQVIITDDMLSQVTSMGFDLDVSRQALQWFGGSVQQAIDELLRTGGVLLVSSPSSSSSSSGSSSGSASSSSSQPGSSSPVKSPEQLKREREAIETIIPDIPEDEEDHLDVSLDEEFQVLQQYKTLLESIR